MLRAIATLRVVLYHGTGDPRWSWFAAMPVMFFVGGSLYAKSLDRRPGLVLLKARLRRILIPFWGWAALVFVVYTVEGAWSRVPWWGIFGFVMPIVPAAGAGARGSGTGAAHIAASQDLLYWTYMGLWYITAYIIFMIIGIPLRRFQQRAPWWCMGVLAAPVVLSALLRQPIVGAPTFMLVFWILGYMYHDHRSSLPPVWVTATIAAVSAIAGIGYALAVHTGVRVNIVNYPFVLDSVGFAVVCLVLSSRSLIAQVVRIHTVDVVVSWFQQRALTIYLWHPLALGIILWIHGRVSLEKSYLFTLVELLPMTFVLATAVGWLEDYAAGRRLQVLPKFSGTIDLRRGAIDLSPWLPPAAEPDDATVIDLRPLDASRRTDEVPRPSPLDRVRKQGELQGGTT